MSKAQRSEARGKHSSSAVDIGRNDAIYDLAYIFLSIFLALPVEEQASFNIVGVAEDENVT
jgi:hypothetical protein